MDNPKVVVARPVPADIPISSPFGIRVLQGVSQFHKGTDFACPIGTEIRAVADGIVNRAGWENPNDPQQGYGLRVWQTAQLGGQMFDIWYGHCLELLVKTGEMITKGQVIAKSGKTGHVESRYTGPNAGAHLHLGIRKTRTGEFYDVAFEEEAGPPLPNAA